MSKPRHEPFKPGEEAREMGRRAGIKSGKVRRLKRTLREWAEIFRDTPTKADPRLTMGGAVALRMYDEAMLGNVRAARLLAELQGEMEEQISIKEIPKMIDDI
ncbi:MAG: hypothetical protein IKF72_12655 [Kiritimatiellae bacterium]|nr:hypothetical protein [Kiritimatiellia bacterium]